MTSVTPGVGPSQRPRRASRRGAAVRASARAPDVQPHRAPVPRLAGARPCDRAPLQRTACGVSPGARIGATRRPPDIRPGAPARRTYTATHANEVHVSLESPLSHPAPPTPDASSRRRFLTLAGARAGASMTALLAACGGSSKTSATSSSTQSTAAAGSDGDGTAGDVDVLNYALTLEYLEAGFYAKVVGSGLLKGAEQDLAKRFGAAEQAHVETIRSTITKLGGKPVPEPKAKFPLDDRMSVLKLAATVENLGAAAYLGQAGNISSPDVLSAALSIHSVEARHAAALNNLLGRKVTPDGAFAKPASKQDVLKAVQPFLVS